MHSKEREFFMNLFTMIRNRNLTLLAISSLIIGIPYGFMYWALPLIIAHVGGSTIVGFIYSVGFLFSTLSSLIGGILADIYGRKLLIIIGTIIYLISMIIPIIFSHTIFMVIMITVLYFTALSISSGALQALIAESSPKDLLDMAYSIISTATLFGSIIGSFSLGYIFQKISTINTFVIASLLVLSALFLRLMLIENYTVQVKKTMNLTDIRMVFKELKNLFRNKLILITIITIIASLESNIDGPYYSIYMKIVQKIDEINIGIAFSIIPFIMAIMNITAGKLIDKMGSYLLLILSNICGGSLVLMFVLTINPFAIIFLIATSLFVPFHNISITTLTARLTTEENRAVVFGSLGMLWSIISIPANSIGSLLWSVSPQAPFYVASMLSFLEALLVLYSIKQK
ncbi:MAG: MFS transporter [Thermoprotei archaeon]